jgi:hypothetical protein
MNYRSVLIKNEWGGMDEKKRRCTLGGFAVKRKSTCDFHRFKKVETIES